MHMSWPHRCRHMYLCLCGGAVFICAADVDAVVASAAAVSCIHISTQDTPNDVAQMRHVVDVGQRTCDQDISSACSRHFTCTISAERHDACNNRLCSRVKRGGKGQLTCLTFHMHHQRK